MSHYALGSSDPADPSTIVAADDGVIRGFVTTGPADAPGLTGRGEVLALYVDPEAWGVGVGRRLLAHARKHLVARGCTEAVLWVLVGNDRAQRFYQIDGWALEGGRRTAEVWNLTVDEVRYRRPLP